MGETVSRYRRKCDRWRKRASSRPARPSRNSSPPRRPPPAPSRSATPRLRAGAKDISSKAIAYAEKNVQASLDYAQSLLKAKDLTEVMRLHSEYVQAQMRALAEQASEMGQVVSQGRHGRGQAENLTSASLNGSLRRARRRAASDAGLNMRRRTRNCIALHKFDMIWVFIGRARGWALPVSACVRDPFGVPALACGVREGEHRLTPL